ncbi:C2H2 type zinc-finger-domain-containing protein [Podospora didyma]|uniref:C2H2 type zinc-finger-domain-containing protein n=1 Tax=Podospora didyma TaxID=330526 RepID=A0AAE0NQI8_9PEZI|nr:C2H2 type zinc-finger-domain-containing protein [Podospora didyma]
MSTLTISSTQCNACNVSFETPELRRAHAKSEWHVANIRRRVAGLTPLPQPSPSLELADSGPDSDHTAEDDDSSDESLGSAVASGTAPEFVLERCLFCNVESTTFDNNVAHMRKVHGLFVPDVDHLVVDLVAVIRYLHLVIFSFHECLHCHSLRQSAEAAQQHMLGKGHCTIDISHDDSEYLDFYDFGTADGNDEDGEQRQPSSWRTPGVPSSQLGDDSTRLPSGKLISRRSATQPSQHRQRSQQLQHPQLESPSTDDSSVPANSAPPSASDASQPADSPSSSLTKSEKRGLALVKNMGTLSLSDQTTLSRLSGPEQRALLATQKNQKDAARRAELRYRNRVETLGNKTLMKHFKPDVPGPKNG